MDSYMEPSSGDFLCVHTQICLILCNPMNYIAHQAPLSMGILQARVLERVAMPFLGVLVFRNYNLTCT